jgi:hypothetical protein
VYRKRLELKEIESQRKLSEAPLLARMKMTKKNEFALSSLPVVALPNSIFDPIFREGLVL